VSFSPVCFLQPGIAFPLPGNFDFQAYIETEQELWAFFPETVGKRVNFCQIGLTAQIFVEAAEDGSELGTGETYFLMPCGDGSIRPLRMRALRRLTLSEFRMSHLTAMRLTGELSKMGDVFDSVHSQVLGDQAYSDLGSSDAAWG